MKKPLPVVNVPKGPCSTCPYAKATPSGVWHPEEYAKLPAYDRETWAQPPSLFLCHHSPTMPGDTVCFGWLAVHGDEALGLRLAMGDGRIEAKAAFAAIDGADCGEFYESGAEAAKAGMAAVESPSPAACRAVQTLTAKRRAARKKDDLQRIADVVWQDCVKFCHANCCVLATRVFCDVAREFGHESEGVCVSCAVQSDSMRVLLGFEPMVKKDLEWFGHLAAIVDGKWLVDCSVSQACRPGKCDVSGTALVTISQEWLAGEAFVFARCDETGVSFQWSVVENDLWRDSPDWQDSQLGYDLVRGVLAKLRGEPFTYPPLMRLLAESGIRI
jgi:hypothetical protein